MQRPLAFLGFVAIACVHSAAWATDDAVRTTASYDPCETGLGCEETSGLWIDDGDWRPLDTLELFGGLEGSKQPQDFGVNANFGGRVSANWGVPLLEDAGLGLQVGTSLNVTDNAVQVFERLGIASDRVQNFSTFGLFQRLDNGLNWAGAYDLLVQDSYDTFVLGQFRGLVGYAVTPTDEIGVWGAVPVDDDDGRWNAVVGSVPVGLHPIGQGNAFWTHTWENFTETSLWAGVAEGHGEVNAALGDLEPTDARFVFGSDLHVPLSDSIAIYGAANFVSPADSGTVDAYLGFAFYPGGTSHGFRKRRFAPRLAVANSPWFAVDLKR